MKEAKQASKLLWQVWEKLDPESEDAETIVSTIDVLDRLGGMT